MPVPRTNRTLSARSPKQRRDWQPLFLEALQQGHTVASACRVAGVGRTTAYEARRRDEQFALAWQDLEEGAVEVLEAEAYRRAMAGSDKLMEFLLKARRPQVYRERVDLRHGGEADAREAEARERVRRMSREEKERLLAEAGSATAKSKSASKDCTGVLLKEG